MNIETNKVRVISNTTSENFKEINKMIGGEYKVIDSLYERNEVLVWNNKEGEDIWFNKSDVRFLTPIKFKDRHVAIGDKIKTHIGWEDVISFYTQHHKTTYLITETVDYRVLCLRNEETIEDHDPGIETDDKTEEDIGKHYKQGRQDEWERCVNLLDFDHSECPEPTSCIGYQSAQSDLMNNPPNIKEEIKGGGGGEEAKELLRQMGENESEEVKKAVETLTRQGYKVTLE
jgi:hypothetical protein